MVHLPFLLMLAPVQYTLYMELDVQELPEFIWLVVMFLKDDTGATVGK